MSTRTLDALHEQTDKVIGAAREALRLLAVDDGKDIAAEDALKVGELAIGAAVGLVSMVAGPLAQIADSLAEIRTDVHVLAVESRS